MPLLDDLSERAIAEQRAFYAQWQDRFRSETPAEKLNPEDAADWHSIDDQIGLGLLEFDRIQSYKHCPNQVVELIGNALYLPLTETYASKEVRVGHVLSRLGQVPRLLDQVKQYLGETDPIFVETAIQENDGNIDLIQSTILSEIPAGSPLKAEYDKLAPPALAALKAFSQWLKEDLGKRPSKFTWRLGKEFYDPKFRLVMETDVNSGASTGRRGKRYEIGAGRNAGAGPSHARTDVPRPRRPFQPDRPRSRKQNHRRSAARRYRTSIRGATNCNKRWRAIWKASSNSFVKRKLFR